MSRDRELLTAIHARAVLLSQLSHNPAIGPLVKNLVRDSEKALELEEEARLPEPKHIPRRD